VRIVNIRITVLPPKSQYLERILFVENLIPVFIRTKVAKIYFVASLRGSVIPGTLAKAFLLRSTGTDATIKQYARCHIYQGCPRAQP
jgi:hypothetical protein